MQYGYCERKVPIPTCVLQTASLTVRLESLTDDIALK
jgi:hypothetical protein